MPAYVFCRHLVKDEETLREYIEGLDRISQASELSKSKNYGFTFGTTISINRPELRKTVYESLENHPGIEITNLDSAPRGAGTAFKEALFNSSHMCRIPFAVMLDLDEYVINTEDSLGALNDFIEKVEKDDALFGIGARDRHVNLGRYERNSNLRIIHELFHSCAIGPEKLRVKSKQNMTPAYAEIGDSTPGFYVANLHHHNYPNLLYSVAYPDFLRSSAPSQVDFNNSFPVEYYTSIKASLLGKIVASRVSYGENKFYGPKTEEEEFESFENLISSSTRELAKTDIKRVLENAVQNDNNLSLISRFYPMKDVKLVREWMLAELTS